MAKVTLPDPEGEEYSPQALITALEKAFDLRQDYDSDAGVDEGYSIRKHTLMVLLQFDSYFSHRTLPLNMSVTFWRVLLALHDVLAKPEAIRKGNLHHQHKVLYKKLPVVLKQLGHGKYEAKLAQELLANNCIGAYVQGQMDIPKVMNQAKHLARIAHSSVDEALDAMILYWMVDAGSYTKDAGGKQSLDYLFRFDHQAREMKVNDPTHAKLQLLKSKVQTKGISPSLVAQKPNASSDPRKRVKYLVPGNRGRMLNRLRTSFEITRLLPDVGMFEIEILEHEDKGSRWRLPYEDVVSYEFLDDSQVLPAEACVELVRTIIKFDQPLIIPRDESKRPETLRLIAEDRTKCRQWLKEKGVKPFDPEPYIASKTGSKLFIDLAQEYLQLENLEKLDTEFSTNFVRNPHSGELIKGHSIVLAELGLVDFSGKIIRDNTLFNGRWSKSRRAKHIIKRLALTQGLWSLTNLSSVTLYRAYGHPEAFVARQPSFISTTFSFEVADEIFKAPTNLVATLLRQEAPLDRLFMTFLETGAMNRQYHEAEAIVLADRDNPIF